MTNISLEQWNDVLDIGAKVVTILAGIGLWVAYRQYKHSVRLAEKNERRAAVELAARECAHYGSVLMKQLMELVKEIDSNCEYLKHCKVIKGENQIKIDLTSVTEADRIKMKDFEPKVICVLNSFEGFAIPFANGVADDKIGFMECGHSFTKIFEEQFPLFCVADLQRYYKASQALYWRWKKQIEIEELERKHLQTGKEFFVLNEKLAQGKSKSKALQWFASFFRKLADHLSKNNQ